METEKNDNEIIYLTKLLNQVHAGRDHYYNAKFPLDIHVLKNGYIWELEVSLPLDIACKEGLERISGRGRRLDEAVADFQNAWEHYVDDCFEHDYLVFKS